MHNELFNDMDQKKNGSYSPLFTSLPHSKICELLKEGYTEKDTPINMVDKKVGNAGRKIMSFIKVYRTGDAGVQLIYSVPDEYGLVYFITSRRVSSKKFCVQYKVYMHKGRFAVANKYINAHSLVERLIAGGDEFRLQYNLYAANVLGRKVPLFLYEYHALYLPVTSQKKYKKLPPPKIEGAILPSHIELEEIEEQRKNNPRLSEPLRECSFPGCVRRGRAKSFKVCNACKVGCYCNDTCQRSDWPHHASVCKTNLMQKSLT
jgi:hypothetical protein